MTGAGPTQPQGKTHALRFRTAGQEQGPRAEQGSSLNKREEARTHFPPEPPQGPQPGPCHDLSLEGLFQTPDPQDCKTISSCGFKPPSSG